MSLSEYSNHEPTMIAAHDHQTAKIEIAQAVYNWGARGIDIGIRAAFVSPATARYEKEEADRTSRVAFRAASLNAYQDGVVDSFRHRVRHAISCAHKTIHGLSSCEPVAGNWSTVY